MAGTHPAHPMTQVDAIAAARASHWPMMHRKNHAVPLTERHNLRARLHARPLLGEHEFAAREVSSRRLEQESGLKREHVFPIEILVQAVVVALAISQEKRRRTDLAGAVATIEI